MNWVLKAHGLAYELEVLAHGDRALDYVHQLANEAYRRAPTLVLLDLYLPQVDGKEVLRQLKALPHGADIPVVTGAAGDGTHERSQGQRDHDDSQSLETDAGRGCENYQIEPVTVSVAAVS